MRPMLKKLQVRNLPPSVDAAELEDLFTTVGNVISASVVENMPPGMGQNQGYVEMSTEQEAADCIARFNGQVVQGHILIVMEDQPHVPQPRKQLPKRSQVAGVRKRSDPASKALGERIRAAIVSARK